MPDVTIYLDETGEFKPDSPSAICGFAVRNMIEKKDFDEFWKQFGFDRQNPFHALDKKNNNSKLKTILKHAVPFTLERKMIPLVLSMPVHLSSDKKHNPYLTLFSFGIIKWLKDNLHRLTDINSKNLTINIVYEQYRMGRLYPISNDPSVVQEKLQEALEREIIIEWFPGRIRPTFNLIMGGKTESRLWLPDLLNYTYGSWVLRKGNRDIPQEAISHLHTWINGNIHSFSSGGPGDRINSHLHAGNPDQALFTALVLLQQKEITLEDEAWKSLIEQMAGLPDTTLQHSLVTLSDTLLKRIDFLRDEKAEKMIDTLDRKVLPSLEEDQLSSPALQSIRLHIYTSLSSIHNHTANIRAHEELVNRMDRENFTLTGLTDLQAWLRVQINLATDLINDFRFSQARDTMEPLTDNLETLSSLFGEELGLSGFCPRILGEARGTLLQAGMYMALQGEENWDDIRKISDQALEDFKLDADISRQQQYRCQIETWAGDFQQARAWLCRSMGLKENSDYRSLLGYLAEMEQPHAGHLFLMLHLLRLMVHHRYNDEMADEEITPPWKEIRKGKELDPYLERRGYPAAGVLRFAVILDRLSGFGDDSLPNLKKAVNAQQVTVRALLPGALTARVSLLPDSKRRAEQQKQVQDTLESYTHDARRMELKGTAAWFEETAAMLENSSVEDWLAISLKRFPF